MFKKTFSLIFLGYAISYNWSVKAMENPNFANQINTSSALNLSYSPIIESILNYLNSLKTAGIDITNLDELQLNLNSLNALPKKYCITIAKINNHCSFLKRFEKYIIFRFTEENLKTYQELLYKIFLLDCDSVNCLLSVFNKFFEELIETYQLAEHKEDVTMEPMPEGFLEELTKVTELADCLFQKLPVSQLDTQIYKFPDINLQDINILLGELVNHSSRNHLIYKQLLSISNKIFSYIFEHYYIFESKDLAHLCLIFSKINLLPPLNSIMSNNQTLLMFLIFIPNSKIIQALVDIITKANDLIEQCVKINYNHLTISELQIEIYKQKRNYWYTILTLHDNNGQTALHHAAEKLFTLDEATHQAPKQMFECLLKIIEIYQLNNTLDMKDNKGITPYQTLSNCGYYIGNRSTKTKTPTN